MGHEDAFLPPRLSGRYWFSQATFAGTSGNGEDAPKAVHQGDRERRHLTSNPSNWQLGREETFWSRFLNSPARRARLQAAKNKPLIFRQ
jgi:hypothetical protein